MNISLSVASTLFAASALHASSHCSLSVKVHDPSGADVEARVWVEESGGRKSEQETSDGVARFCDLGITPVTVIVGLPGCNQVIVRDVSLNWDQPRDLNVTYDLGGCNSETIPLAICRFLLRFADSGRDAIGGASLLTSKPFSERHEGDEFGRIFLKLAAGEELVGIASAAGYKPTEVDIPCDRENRVIERLFVLEKTGP